MNKEEARRERNKMMAYLTVAENHFDKIKQKVEGFTKYITELEAIINKKDDWRDGLTMGDYAIGGGSDGLEALYWHYRAKAEHTFEEKEHAQLSADKMNLMLEMYAFAHVRNEGWEPDWKDEDEDKWGVEINEYIEGVYVDWNYVCNFFVFGIAVKSKEIANEMLEEFGERIEKIYNKQY